MRARDLLYDTGCSLCAALAREVETLSEGRLRVRSLREPEVQALLDRVRPGWRWESMPLEEDGERVRVYTGLAMRMRLVRILGPARALRVAQAVARFGGPVLGVDWERRTFLRRAIGALGGWIALRGLGQPAPAAAALPTPPAPGLPPIRRSRLLEGEERAALLREFRSHPDLQALGLSAPGPESEAIAVLHELADGNRLEVVAWVVGEKEILAAYRFIRPQALTTSIPVQSEALRIVVEEERARLAARSMNGQLTAGTQAGGGTSIQPMSHCPGCINRWTGPWASDCLSCANWDFNCIATCGVLCGAACFTPCASCLAGNGLACVGCMICVSTACPWCISSQCCRQWVHDCCACGGCSGP